MLSLFRKIRKNREIKREYKRLLSLINIYMTDGKKTPSSLRKDQFRMIVRYGCTVEEKARQQGLTRLEIKISNTVISFASYRMHEIVGAFHE